MAIMDAINRITGQNVGGSIEDALMHMQKQNEDFVPILAVVSTTENLETTYAVTPSSPLNTIIAGFNDGKVKSCIVNLDGVNYQTSMISTSIEYDAEEDPETATLSAVIVTPNGGMNTVIGTYTYSDETTTWEFVELVAEPAGL